MTGQSPGAGRPGAQVGAGELGMGVRKAAQGGERRPDRGERRPRGPVNKAREGEAAGGARAQEAGAGGGAGAREAPPLTITIDAPRIMKIMVFALMDIGRGRAGPERRPPAPAPPRPRPDAEPLAPPQRSARRAPTAAGRGGGVGQARAAGDASVPGSLGRRAAALGALRSALGPASLPPSRPARPPPGGTTQPPRPRTPARPLPGTSGQYRPWTPARGLWSPGHVPTRLEIVVRAPGLLPFSPLLSLRSLLLGPRGHG